MNFDLSEEQRIGVDSFRRFLVAEVKPTIDRFASDVMPKAIVHDLFRKLSPFGLGSGWVPTESGGAGLDLITSGLLYEELSRVSSGLAAQVCVNDSVSLLLHKIGTADQQARYLPGLLSGELIASIAVTEPGVGSQPGGIRTRAVRDGENWRISGEKCWISNCDVSDLAVVVCRTDDGPSMVLVERADGYKSRNFGKLGQKEKSTGQLLFDDVRVPLANLVGQRGEALKIMARLFERARCMVALYATGIASAALDASIEYARTREQWGKPIGGHQLVQSMLAEMATEIDCSRLLAFRGLAMVEQGQRCEMQASMAKWYASEAAIRVTSHAIQIHGAYGLSTEFPLERYFRDARMMTIPDGTTQIQKLIIGRNLTGMAAFE
ncbi:MAG: acyl-CoA/acyl-ACP dehydrogenase [Xanthobacteraceae bacterium]|nr:acyl-CoA/acyl-ACP dehydrogenase [Xanthobacteraceae bacterium]